MSHTCTVVCAGLLTVFRPVDVRAVPKRPNKSDHKPVELPTTGLLNGENPPSLDFPPTPLSVRDTCDIITSFEVDGQVTLREECGMYGDVSAGIVGTEVNVEHSG